MSLRDFVTLANAIFLFIGTIIGGISGVYIYSQNYLANFVRQDEMKNYIRNGEQVRIRFSSGSGNLTLVPDLDPSNGRVTTNQGKVAPVGARTEDDPNHVWFIEKKR